MDTFSGKRCRASRARLGALLDAVAEGLKHFSASSPGTRPRSDEPKPAPDWVAALTAEERAKPWWQRISCGLCNLDHIDRGALALTSCKEDGAMASMRTCEGWWDLSLIDDRSERPLLSAFVAIICCLGDDVPVLAFLSARGSSQFFPADLGSGPIKFLA